MPPLHLMLLKLMLWLGLCLPHQSRWKSGRKKFNGDFVLRPKLMNSPSSKSKNTAVFKSVKKKKLVLHQKGTCFSFYNKNIINCIQKGFISLILF